MDCQKANPGPRLGFFLLGSEADLEGTQLGGVDIYGFRELISPEFRFRVVEPVLIKLQCRPSSSTTLFGELMLAGW